MKDQKKSILIFSLFWVIGITGGYLLGVGSQVLPKDDINYNLYLPANQYCANTPEDKAVAEEDKEKATEQENKKDYFIILRQFQIDKIPALVANTVMAK